MGEDHPPGRNTRGVENRDRPSTLSQPTGNRGNRDLSAISSIDLWLEGRFSGVPAWKCAVRPSIVAHQLSVWRLNPSVIACLIATSRLWNGPKVRAGLPAPETRAVQSRASSQTNSQRGLISLSLGIERVSSPCLRRSIRVNPGDESDGRYLENGVENRGLSPIYRQQFTCFLKSASAIVNPDPSAWTITGFNSSSAIRSEPAATTWDTLDISSARAPSTCG